MFAANYSGLNKSTKDSHKDNSRSVNSEGLLSLADQGKYINTNYLTESIKSIARSIGRSQTFVRAYLKRSDLVIPQSIIEERKRSSYYQKGSTPLNKGKKWSEWMSKEGQVNSTNSQFKKGRTPHNTRANFELSKRATNGKKYPYWYIRISLGKWVLLHRYLWEIVNGEIPKGHNIQFIDGNTDNVEIENLEIVSRKKQVIHNKNGGKKLSPELKETIELINSIKNKINEKSSN